MKIASNTKLINRNQKIARYTTFAALAILGVGLYISFTAPEAFSWSLGALVVGFLLSQVGMTYSNKFGKSPRPDEALTASLKGLEEKYTLYHYNSPVNHLLVGPAGVWVLMPYFQGGAVSYNPKKNRWTQKGGNFFLKLFGQESLGRPDLEVQYNTGEIKKFLEKQLPEAEIPEIKAALVFFNKSAVLNVEDAPVPALPGEKVKDFFRKQAKESSLSPEVVTLIQKILPPGE
ncbi:hypothetical protein LARV_02415 [Longilinea arvoryzae]|uniref:NERD domain-containing protein n=1 Tax=Longilinea arvoryzae TaxID=360412 RepID=A0A0S7BKA4_9CHLR|nr:hypothetical protein [Longilinea arvoryzae]GAP14642.1 hypothetical protein LARV_02415 [Longilinea arvoryzae]